MFFQSRRHFDACLRPIRPALYRLAVATVGGPDAADALQDALVKAWVDIESAAWNQSAQFHPQDRRNAQGEPVGQGSDLFYFLVPFVRAACHSTLRKMRLTRQMVLPLETVLAMADEGAPPDVSGDLWSERRLEIYRLLERVHLSARQEMCIRLWLEGNTQHQIADYFGIAQSTVSAHTQRAAATLREAYWHRQNLGMQALEVLDEIARDGAASVYHKPQQVWDRKGDSRQIQERRYRVFDEENQDED